MDGVGRYNRQDRTKGIREGMGLIADARKTIPLVPPEDPSRCSSLGMSLYRRSPRFFLGLFEIEVFIWNERTIINERRGNTLNVEQKREKSVR